jgi:hypothetical protein
MFTRCRHLAVSATQELSKKVMKSLTAAEQALGLLQPRLLAEQAEVDAAKTAK